MGTKVKKSLLRPIRYFSQIFDNNKEPEMQIGLPTDVKHVAHIGLDGPSINSSPGWMKEFHSAPLTATGPEQKDTPSDNLWGSQDYSRMEAPGLSCSSLDNISATEALVNDNAIVPVTKPRRARRAHQSDKNASIDSADTSEGSTRRNRRHQRKETAVADAVSDVTSSPQNLPAIPKHRRRSKQGSTSEGPVKSSSKAKAAAEEDGDNLKNDLPAISC